jgi:hypothetical protein
MMPHSNYSKILTTGKPNIQPRHEIQYVWAVYLQNVFNPTFKIGSYTYIPILQADLIFVEGAIGETPNTLFL